jgi:hypothetical protein
MSLAVFSSTTLRIEYAVDHFFFLKLKDLRIESEPFTGRASTSSTMFMPPRMQSANPIFPDISTAAAPDRKKCPRAIPRADARWRV